MSGVVIKTILPILLTLATALGAYNIKIEYDRPAGQEKLGHLIMELNKSCSR